MTKYALRVAVLLCLALTAAVIAPEPAVADDASPVLTVSGHVRNEHGEGVAGVSITAVILRQPAGPSVGPGRSARSDDEGIFILDMSLTAQQVEALKQPATQVVIKAGKSSFSDGQTVTQSQALAVTASHYFAEVDIVLHRKPTPAVFLAALILLIVYVLISLERLHRTVAALLGASVVLFITHVAGHFNPDFVILPFERAVTYIDFNVIFLLMAMMVIVTVTARTGVFQWLAVAAYRQAGGNIWRLAVLLMAATAVLSAFLDNVTTMLLIVPVTIEIALILRINALALLLPEVFASNIGGAATLIGDPPNLLIGSFAGLGFDTFLINMAPAVVLAMVGLVVLVQVMFRGQFPQTTADEARELLRRLEKDFQITDRQTLRQALVVFALVVMLFLASSALHMEPSVPALLGMGILLVWTKADIVQELEGVEWPSLLFFIGLFIVVGAAHETGVIEALADVVATAAGGNVTLAIILIVWITAVASMLIDNIPITATMLPVVAFLSHEMPEATNNVLYWALAFGACFGGNGTIVGASANIVTAGLAERAGYTVTFGQFARRGIPVTIMSLVVATAWLLLTSWLS